MIDRRSLLTGTACLMVSGCKTPRDETVTSTLQKARPLANRHGLVELRTLDPTIRLDIRYATANNFTGQILYPQARAFLQEAAALAVRTAHRALAQHGLGLTIFDGYRPRRITQLMWDVTPRSKRNYVANPKDGSRHNRGCAVDLTMHRLSDGTQVVMPSDYDEFTARAHHDFMTAPADARANRALLRDTMQAHGFFAMANEWWHYDFKDWRGYPLLDIGFEAL